MKKVSTAAVKATKTFSQPATSLIEDGAESGR